MSNIFKHNSRFASLAEEIEKPIKKEEKRNEKREEKKESMFKENSFLREETNSFKRDYQRRDYRYESYIEREDRIKKENIKKEEENKKKKEEEAKKNLAEENFPEFLSKTSSINNNNNKNKNTISYSEKAAKILKKEEKPVLIENNIKPGWVEIKRDKAYPRNRKLIYTYGPGVSESVLNEEPEDNNSDYPVLEALVNLYNNRTQEYIETYGYDTWEKMFRFPNYDYEYFNKLDELYELEEESSIEDDYN